MNAASRHASTAAAFPMNRDCNVPMPMAMRRARRIAMGMTDSKEPSETGTTASETDDAKKKPYVPIADRPLLGVPEAEALTGVPAKIIRAQVRNGLLKARMAGSTTMRIRRADLDAWLDALPAWHA